MNALTHDDWRFVLWSILALELLARAALSEISPTLLADPKDWKNTLHALEIEPKATKFVPRSIDISQVISRLQEIITDFGPELSGFALAHMSRRNEELHSGISSLDGLPSSTWLPLYYRASEVLLTSMTESLESYFGAATAASAKAMIAASLDESAKAVAKAISDQNKIWAEKPDPEKETLAAQANAWATKHQGHRVKCPACTCDAVLTGAPIAPPIRNIDGDEIVEVQQYLPSKFECIGCGLKISGLPQLSASGLGNAYKATFTYDATEYYAPDDPYAGYEPDFNER